MTQQILIVSNRDGEVRHALVAHGFELSVVESAPAAYAALVRNRFALLIVNLADAEAGVRLVKQVRQDQSLSRLIILIVAEWGTGQATVALSEGADSFEPWPIEANRLVAAVEKLLRPGMALSAGASAGDSED